MDINLVNEADAMGMFCRLHMNAKRDLPIRASEMGVLIFTHKKRDPVTPMMISQFLNITKPSVSAMVKSLVKGGYLVKEPSETDKRSYRLLITDKGRSLVASTFMEYTKTIERLKEEMGETRFNQFIELLQLANSILEEGR